MLLVSIQHKYLRNIRKQQSRIQSKVSLEYQPDCIVPVVADHPREDIMVIAEAIRGDIVNVRIDELVQ